ncbi:hypothetical protein [Planktothrix agardhii]|jgi:hypothetical protein|uniref:hypothetical protein n=1 Tax=Planktothrix agardhii TaxID=1160 RepID=UPI0020A7E324|nr:hypothetical protein [Planktothrix agardhii]CAD5985284.1 hypothetical protein NO365_04487 [Planktothrix agardhii]
MKLLKIVLIAVISLVVICTPGWAIGPSLAIPKTNTNGDYILPATNRRAIRHINWIVTDKDPQGLNCRMLRQYQGISMDSIDAPEILYKDNYHTITNWSVMTTFKTGRKLQAVTTQLGTNIVLRDKQDKPWIPVKSSREQSKGSCFVRANLQFIKAIPDDPET